MYHTRLTDAQVKELAALKRLTALDLSGTGLTDAGMKELSGLKHLTSLEVRKTKVTLDGIAGLKAELPECVILSDPAPRAAGK